VANGEKKKWKPRVRTFGEAAGNRAMGGAGLKEKWDKGLQKHSLLMLPLSTLLSPFIS
jgi:hypothetical protein